MSVKLALVFDADFKKCFDAYWPKYLGSKVRPFLLFLIIYMGHVPFFKLKVNF